MANQCFMDPLNRPVLNLNWTFLSNNAHVLVCLKQSPQPTIREIALQVGITERAVQRILEKFVEAGIASIEKVGRRNFYHLNLNKRLRHPLEAHRTIGELLELIEMGNKNPGPRKKP